MTKNPGKINFKRVHRSMCYINRIGSDKRLSVEDRLTLLEQVQRMANFKIRELEGMKA